MEYSNEADLGVSFEPTWCDSKLPIRFHHDVGVSAVVET
jgi:hypothetical protein